MSDTVQAFLSEIDPVGIKLLDSMVSCTITVQKSMGEGPEKMCVFFFEKIPSSRKKTGFVLGRV